MKKGNLKSQYVDKKKEDFDATFAKFSQQLPEEYVEQFKRTENIVNLKQAKIRTAQRQGKIEIVKKFSGNKKEEIKNVGKLLEDDGIIEIKTTPKEIAQQVAKYRNERKLTQEQLAKKISESVHNLNELENCSGVYRPNLVSKIEKALGVKIDRHWKHKK